MRRWLNRVPIPIQIIAVLLFLFGLPGCTTQAVPGRRMGAQSQSFSNLWVTSLTPGNSVCAVTGGKLTTSGCSTGTVTGGTNSCGAGLVQTGTTISTAGVPTAICTQKTDQLASGMVALGTNSQDLADIVVDKTEVIPINCTGSYATSVVTATANTTFTMTKYDTSGASTAIGTGLFSAGGRTAAFTCASSVTLTAGQILEITGPATADATLTRMGYTIGGNAGSL
jgi:hypothetical protein